MIVLTSELSIGCVPLLLKGNRFFHVLVSLANVSENARLQALRGGVVFFFRCVVVRFVEPSGCFVEAAYPAEMGVKPRMVFEILSVIDCRRFDFGDSFIDFIDCVFLRIFQFAAIGMRQIRAGMSQLGERVQIGGVPVWRRLRVCADDDC